jgi:type I restriction enzyme R subunit
VTKKGAKYHQFFAVRLAARKTIETVTAGADKRTGVIWHTTGSGKSLSMGFLVGMLRRRRCVSTIVRQSLLAFSERSRWPRPAGAV